MSATHDDDDLLIVRTIDAPATLVFRLWSEPEHFRRWIGPQGFECAEVEIDFRVGGAYRATISSPEAGNSRFQGIYREIEPDRRIVFTFTWQGGPSGGVETIITVLLEERDGRTIQTFHQAPFLNVERRDSHRGGWNSTFDRLRDYAATQLQEHAR
jgi:uncharacterized protein YndB with AHSA1/START domain